ncbi:MAG: FtsX-like permease family protein [Dehalococcoidales bacterium]
MSRFISEWQLITRRSLANWRLLSTIIFGVLIAVALLSSTPFYSNAINDLGLSRALRERQIELLDLHIYAPNYYVNYDDYYEASASISQQVSRNIRSIVRQEETWIKSQDYYAAWADRPILTDGMRPTGYFQVFSNLEKHVTVVEGRYAEPATASLLPTGPEDPNFTIEGMIGSETAEIFGVGVGDQLIFISGYGADERHIFIELTAIIDPIDPTEEFWFLNTNIFTARADQGKVAPIFIPEQTLFEVIGRLIPTTRATYNWFYYIDTDKISAENAGNIKNAVQRMERQLLTTLPRSGMFTILNSVLTQYQGKLMFTQIPLFLIVSQIVAIIMYYLITVANMLIERQSGEIALFRSRGASTWQIIGVYFTEGLMISAIGAAAGPFLGAFVFSLLGKTSAFFPLTGGELLPIRFSGTVFILAGIAGLLCLLALLVPAIQAARSGVVHQRQQAARPVSVPFWQRYYLDLVILAFGGILYWELNERGSLVTVGIFGGLNVDPLLLITPMLLLLAIAIVFLRIFPIFIGLATRFSKYIGNTPVVLGLWYIARNPVHYGRLILLLILTASVGMFSATFLGTLERSYSERALYTAGSDVRLEGLNAWQISKDVLRQQYSSLQGVEKISLAHRVDGYVGTLFTQTRVTLLAVEPESHSQVAWYSEGFSDKPFPELMDLLAKDEPKKQGLELPDGTETMGVWVYPELGNPKLRIFAKVRDGRGYYFDYELGLAEAEGWQYLETKLTALESDFGAEPPFSINSIYVKIEERDPYLQKPPGVYFDDLQVSGSFSPNPVVIEDFEDIAEWTVATDETTRSLSGGTASDKFVLNDEIVHNGDSSAQLIWSRSRRSTTNKGIFPNMDTRPLVAIASQSLVDSAKVSKGDFIQIRIPGRYIPIVIEEVVDYSPTLDPEENGFLIVNIDRLSSPTNVLGAVAIYPNEAWLTVTSDIELRKATVGTLNSGKYGADEFYDKEAMITSLKTDPLAGAGWSGMLMIALLGVILVSSLGFVVYTYLSAQKRQLDFAILRTLGFSFRQIVGLVCFEQLFIIVTGMGIGTLLGERLSYIMIPFLQLTEGGERVLPPFILTINWQTIGTTYAIIGAAFFITIFLVILFFSRVAIHRTLRMGDM